MTTTQSSRFRITKLEDRIVPSAFMAFACDCGHDDEYSNDCDDSHQKGNNGLGNGQDPQPPGNPPVNDGPGTEPGDPGNRPDHSYKDDCDFERVKGNNGVGNGQDPQPPGNPPVNDGPDTSPGNPGNRRR